jgi:hypothetical protein
MKKICTKIVKTFVKKIRKRFIKKIIKKIVNKTSKKHCLTRNQHQVTLKLQRKMVPFLFGQSQFLEAPLVRQADGELKN